MTKIFFITFSLIFFASVAFSAEVTVEYFTTRADGNDVTVEFRSSTEKNILRFEIERSNDNQSFRMVTSLDAKGTNSTYKFLDRDILFKGDPQIQPVINRNQVFYRLKYVGTDNSISYSNAIPVTYNVSSVRRTWGMIKEMFR